MTPRIDKSTPQHHAHGRLVRPRIPPTAACFSPPIPVRVSSYLLSLQGLDLRSDQRQIFFLLLDLSSHRFNLHLELQVQFSALLFHLFTFHLLYPQQNPKSFPHGAIDSSLRASAHLILSCNSPGWNDKVSPPSNSSWWIRVPRVANHQRTHQQKKKKAVEYTNCPLKKGTTEGKTTPGLPSRPK